MCVQFVLIFFGISAFPKKFRPDGPQIQNLRIKVSLHINFRVERTLTPEFPIISSISIPLQLTMVIIYKNTVDSNYALLNTPFSNPIASIIIY